MIARARSKQARDDRARHVLPKGARTAAGTAARFRLLGLLFERPRPGWAEEVRSLAVEAADESLRAIAARALTSTEGGYLGLFGPGGAVSPREVAHRGFADPGRLLADLSSLYDAFAFRPRSEDPPDHVAVEVAFAAYLALKEAYAITAGDREGAERTCEGRALFLEHHLRPFAAGLRTRLDGLMTTGHLGDAAGLLAEWAGCGEADLAAASAIDACGAAAGEGAMTCGGCGESGDESEAKP